jgi:hypothetical protein
MPADASDTFVVGAEPQRRVIRCVWDHNNVGFTTLPITLFRRGGPSGELSGVDVQAFQIVGRSAHIGHVVVVRAQHCDALPQLTDGALERDHVGV